MRVSPEENKKRLEEVMRASQDCKTIAEVSDVTGY